MNHYINKELNLLDRRSEFLRNYSEIIESNGGSQWINEGSDTDHRMKKLKSDYIDVANYKRFESELQEIGYSDLKGTTQ